MEPQVPQIQPGIGANRGFKPLKLHPHQVKWNPGRVYIYINQFERVTCFKGGGLFRVRFNEGHADEVFVVPQKRQQPSDSGQHARIGAQRHAGEI